MIILIYPIVRWSKFMEVQESQIHKLCLALQECIDFVSVLHKKLDHHNKNLFCSNKL